MTRTAIVLAVCLVTCLGRQETKKQEHAAEGMVVSIDRKALSVVISCEAIPGYMDAMEMPFEVRKLSVLDGLHAGVTVRFMMMEEGAHVFAEGVRIVKKLNAEAEPVEAARLEVLHRALDPSSEGRRVKVGQEIPDFVLNDQQQRPVHFSQLRGKVVALTFGYSRCPNPNYCFRLSNNLAQLQRRFAGTKGNDLALVTVLIDSAGDQTGAPGTYAKAWKSDPARWRFLTGPVEDVRSVAALFGMNFWNDEGFWTHSFRTAVVDRDGRLVSNLEGNQFTSKQLGDVVESVLLGQAGSGANKK
jgi:protein SCO1/2